jgi:flagellar hook-associated protein 2
MATALSSLVSTGLSTGGSSTSGATTYAGLGQGINVTAFVQAAEANAQANITNVQDEQLGITNATSALTAITANLTSLQSAVSALNDPFGVLSSQVATSSNPNVLSATATSSALAGTDSISVTSLATTSSIYSGALATSSTPLATGDTIAISAGGTQVASVTVGSTNNTLAGIAAAINSSTTAVQASVITDANGARLAIVSTASGAPGNLTISGTLHDASNNAISLTQAVPGVNAVLTVNGVPISSATNTVSGVIAGVTLNLAGATGGTPVSLTVAPDAASITTAINQFVTDYNTAITTIDAQFQVSTTGGAAPPLQTDSSVTDAQTQLLNAVNFTVGSGSSTTSLARIVKKTHDDGTLTVDSGALAAALSSNFSGVQSLFQTASTGFSANLGTVLTNLAGPGGELALDAQGYQSTASDLTQQLSDLQAALAVQTTNLTATFAQVNSTLEELPLLQSQLGQQLSSVV